MTELNKIKDSIKEHLANYEQTMLDAIKTDVPLLTTILNYIRKEKGKQMRPMFVILSAGMAGSINKSTYRAATMVELLHTASLVHDDVVDDSPERRGNKSINAKWQNKIAVLTGDFLVSKGILLGIENNDNKLMPIIIRAGYEMSEGELLQMEKSLSLDITEDVYFDIITKKTGVLMATCCAAGAASANANEDLINIMYEFGKNIGIAFQIRDDLLDFEKHLLTGKPKGSDIKERKITLPLIYMLNNISQFDKNKIIEIVKNHNQEPDKVDEIIEIVNKSNGIDYSKQQLYKYQNNALNILKQFENNSYVKSLENLVLYNTSRQF